MANTFDVDVSAKSLSVEDEGLVVDIFDPQGDPVFDAEGKPVTVTVAGEYSVKYRKAEEWRRKHLQRLHGKEQTGAEALKMDAEFVARCCFGWNGFMQGGQSINFSTENATMVFQKLPFVRKRVELSIGDHAAFFARGSTNSAST